MALGTRFNVLAGALKATLQEGVRTGEGTVGGRALNTVRDTLFTGAGATRNSRIAGGMALGAGVLAGGYGLEHFDEHPLLGTGALAVGGALLLSRPGSVANLFGRESKIAASAARGRSRDPWDN